MLKWSRSHGFFLAVAWVIMTAAFAWLAFSTALEKETGLWGWIFLIAVSVSALVAAVMLVEGVAGPRAKFRSLLRPRPIAGLYMASFTAFGVAVTIVGQFEPKAATESARLAIENKVDKANEKLDNILRPKEKAPPRILTYIGGLWGEKLPYCGVTYRFKVVGGKGLTIESVRRPADDAPEWRAEASIRPFGESGDVMYTDWQGEAATFTYSTNGISESLRWDGAKSPAVDLVRCEDV